MVKEWERWPQDVAHWNRKVNGWWSAHISKCKECQAWVNDAALARAAKQAREQRAESIDEPT